MVNGEIIIDAQAIKKDYVIKSMQEDKIQKVEVLKGLDMTVKSGEYISVMGRSGSGKTTLLKIMGLTLLPTDGTVFFEGHNILELWKDELADIRRRKIGFVFQNFELLDSLSALDNIMLPGIVDKIPLLEVRKRAENLAEQLELSKKLLGKAPYELSGGERQRVAICRALINNPELILADEPTGNLDEKSGEIVAGIFKEINVTMKKTIVMVTHNPKLASMSKTLYMIRDGKIAKKLERGNSQERYYQEILKCM